MLIKLKLFSLVTCVSFLPSSVDIKATMDRSKLLKMSTRSDEYVNAVCLVDSVSGAKTIGGGIDHRDLR
jgi:hypothetical protein